MVNISTTRAVDDIAQKYNVAVIRTPVGEIHVAKRMKEIGAVIGGEGNGGVLLPELHLGRDAPVAMALTLQYLSEYGGPILQLWKELPQYAMTKKKIDIGSTDPDRILKTLKEKYQNETISLIDGLKIERTDSWIHIRKSNTEPIIRVITEAKTRAASEKICNQTIEHINSL